MTEIETTILLAAKLIEKSVDEFWDFDFYTDGGNIGAKEVEPWLRKTLQDTIDTVLERERERILKIISEEMSRGTMFGNKDEDIAYTLTSKLEKALTPTQTK
jgi:hypothetical protein